MKNRLLNMSFVILALLLVLSLTAAAQTDSAGNVFVGDTDPVQQIVERDLYWAGSGRSFNGYRIGKSLLAAGRDISITDTEVGGSLRAGGYNVTVSGVDVTDNITAGGYSLQMSGVTASGVYLAGNTVYFSGTADHASLAGGTVTLDGEIHGDAEIFAANVILGEELKVDGTLTVQTEKEPSIPVGAKIGEFVFKNNEPIKVSESVTVEVTESKPSNGFGKFIKGLLGTLLLAALIYLMLGPEDVRKPGVMFQTRALPMLGTGFAAIFVIPGVIIILLFTGIGLPSSGLLTLLFTTACIYSLTYTGVTYAFALLPGFTDNKILKNDWVCSLIGALVFWLLRKIPIIGVIIQSAAIIYTLGYFVQSIFFHFRGSAPSAKKAAPANAAGNDLIEPVGTNLPADPTAAAGDETAEIRLNNSADAEPEKASENESSGDNSAIS